MSSTINLLLTYIRPYSFRIMIAFLVFVFLWVGYYAYKSYVGTPTKNAYKDVANTAPNNMDIVVTLYHVDWCPHCKKAMPEWNQFKDEYDGKLVNGYKVVCIDLDCTDDSDQKINDVLKTKGIESFPTVKAVMPGTDGKEMTISFESKTTKKNLEKFVLSISVKN